MQKTLFWKSPEKRKTMVSQTIIFLFFSGLFQFKIGIYQAFPDFSGFFQGFPSEKWDVTYKGINNTVTQRNFSLNRFLDLKKSNLVN